MSFAGHVIAESISKRYPEKKFSWKFLKIPGKDL